MPSMAGSRAGWSPVSWGSIDELFVNLTIPTPVYAGFDLVGAQPQRTLATLDLVPEECKPVPHMDDTRLARMQGDPKRSQDVGSRLQRSHCLRSRPAGDHPIIGVPSQVVAFPTHFPIKWSQKNTVQEWGDDAALRRALFRWETRSLSDAPSLEEARDQLEYTTVGDTLIHQDPELLMVGIVKLTKSSSIDPQDTGLQPAVNPPCWASRTAVGLNLTIPSGANRRCYESAKRHCEQAARRFR